MSRSPEHDARHGLGGFVGLVRDASGVPLAGATVRSIDAGSGAVVRHPSNDGTFNTTATQDLGLFVILGPSLAETFEVELDGGVIGSVVPGSANGVVLAAAVTVP